MKPSTARLFSMLPRVLVMRFDVVDGKQVGLDLLDGAGKPTGLDADYPGFAECLARLVKAGLVIDAGHSATGTQSKGRVTRLFISLRPSSTSSKGPST